MKASVVYFLSLCFCAAFAEDQVSTTDGVNMVEINQINENCRKQVGLDHAVLKKIMETLVLPKYSLKYRQFLTCSYKKQGYQNEEGHILYNNIKKFLAHFYKMENLKILDECASLYETREEGDNAFNAVDCILPKLQSLDVLEAV